VFAYEAAPVFVIDGRIRGGHASAPGCVPGSEEGSYLRLIVSLNSRLASNKQYLYHSTLGLRVKKQEKRSVPARHVVRHAQPLYRNVQWFRGGLLFEAHRLVHHSTLGLRVIKKKKTRAGQSTRALSGYVFFFFITPKTSVE